MSANDPKGKSQKRTVQPNSLETLKEFKNIGKDAASKMRQEAAQLPRDFMQELLGIQKSAVSGEIYAGESVEMNEVMSGKHEILRQQRKREVFIKEVMREEFRQKEKKTNELRMQLKALQEEIIVLAQNTENLAEETQVAAMQAPVDPGEYHVIFFEKLLGFIKSFRKKIEEAKTWLHAVNKRTAKKNAWGANYKKHGAKYLLSGEHYLTRSAG